MPEWLKHSMNFLEEFIASLLPILEAQQRYFFISRDACSDSIAKLFRACFFLWGYRTIIARCVAKMGYRTDVSVLKLGTRGGYRTILGESANLPDKVIARYGVSQAIVSQYRAIMGPLSFQFILSLLRFCPKAPLRFALLSCRSSSVIFFRLPCCHK